LNAWSRKAAALACGLVAVLSEGAMAAPRAVEAFDAGTWRSLQASLKQPAVVVFSATWCPNCPAVIEDLAHDIRERKLKASLVAVVMDVAPGEGDARLMQHAHYRLADRLFAFSGQAPPIRYKVDPRWLGITPYVVFLTPRAPARVVTGPPSDDDVQAWVRQSAKPVPAAAR
jgi:thiol-disulfide isomerase/thioredoxin